MCLVHIQVYITSGRSEIAPSSQSIKTKEQIQNALTESIIKYKDILKCYKERK